MDKEEAKNAFMERKLVEVCDLAFQHGLKSYVEKYGEFKEDFDKEKFTIYCHDGFKKAQDEIIMMIGGMQEEQEELEVKIAAARQSKDKDQIKKLQEQNVFFDFWINRFKHVADGLAWGLIGGQLYISRRLFQNVGGSKKLKYTNIESVIGAAHELNKDPYTFALITDLTHCVQAGDIIKRTKDQFYIYEVKTGEQNKKVLDLIDEFELKDDLEKIENLNLGKSLKEHVTRTVNQLQSLKDIYDILAYDYGYDSKLQAHIKIVTPNEPADRFIEKLKEMEDGLIEKTWHYCMVEGCLHLGMYRSEYRHAGAIVLKGIAESSHDKFDNYIIVDYMQLIGTVNAPVFNSPLKNENVMNLMTGRLRFFYLLDLDRFIEMMPYFGVTAHWLSRSESTKYDSDYFKLNNRALKIICLRTDKNFVLGNGFFARMFFEFQTPFYTAYTLRYYLDNYPTEEELKRKR